MNVIARDRHVQRLLKPNITITEIEATVEQIHADGYSDGYVDGYAEGFDRGVLVAE